MNTKLKTQSSPPSDEVTKDHEDKETSEQETDHKKDEEAESETDCSEEVDKPEENEDDDPGTEANSELSCEKEGAAAENHSEEPDADKYNEDEASKEGNDDTRCVSKLEAEALSASLSSSRCLLKRNREDLDTDSDNDDKEEEPDSKKSHKAVEKEEDKDEAEEVAEEESVTPVVVSASKLSSSELAASMSSSKSVLKRGFEQVDHCKEPEVKVKKSLLTETSPVLKESPPSPERSNEEAKRSPPCVNSSQTKDRQSFNVKSAVIPVSPRSEVPPLLESTRLTSPSEQRTPNKSPTSQREMVRVIGAKDLEEDRKLERKRLNKMLLIFSDQKPV